MDSLIKNYGALIREAREQKKLSSRELAAIFGGTHAQISYIENEKVALTLNAAFRLAHSLELPLENLFAKEIVQAMPLHFQKSSIKKEIPKEHQCLNYNDIDFLDMSGVFSSGDFSGPMDEAIEFFVDEVFDKDSRIEPPLYKFIYSCLGVKDLEKRLIDLPPLNKESDKESDRIGWIDFRYPRHLSFENIRNNYLSGGNLLFLDIGAYLNRIRISKELSLKQLGNSVGLSDRGIRKLEYQTPEKLRLEDVLKLDIALNMQGELLDFAWTVAKFYAGVYRTKSQRENGVRPFQTFEIHGLEKLTVLSRLYQHYISGDLWLKELRRIFKLPSKI